MGKLKADLIKRLQRVDGLEERASRVAGGSALFYRGREIAHFHHDNEIDVRLTSKVIRRVKLVHPRGSKFHKVRSSSSQWIELRFTRASDLDEVVRLFKLALEQY